MDQIKTTNRLLLLIAIPLVFFILKTLNFIFVPLILAMFIALLFLPLMRLLGKHKVPKAINIIIVILILIAFIKGASELVKLSANEIMSAKDEFVDKAEVKLTDLLVNVESFFGIDRVEGESVTSHYFKNLDVQSFGSTFEFLRNTLTMLLMTIFFVILLLSDSIDFQKILNRTILKKKYSSVKSFRKIEKDIVAFVKVKFLVSFFTGVGFSLACVFFDVSFPIFWGLFAFLINFVQMVGSVISVILLSLFAFVELDSTGTLVFFILVITGVQVLMGGILEPVFMGKTFSVNVITVLIMLMLWGYIWGIPGLILSIPITVFLKIIFDQFEGTRTISTLMSGSDKKTHLSIKVTKFFNKKKTTAV